LQRNARRAQRELSGGRADAQPEACTGAVSGVRTAEICQAAGARMFSSTERCCWLAFQDLFVVNLLVRETSLWALLAALDSCVWVYACVAQLGVLSCLACQFVGVNVWWAAGSAVLSCCHFLYIPFAVCGVCGFCGQLGVLCCVPCHSLPPRKQRNCVLQRLGGGVVAARRSSAGSACVPPFSNVCVL